MTAIPPGAGRGDGVMGFVVSDLMTVFLALAGVAGIVFQRPGLTVLGTLVLVLALVCRVWARHALAGLTYRCELSSDRVMEGDEVVLDLVIENHRPWPVAWLRVREHVPHGLVLGAEEDAPVVGAGGATGSVLLIATTALAPRERVRLSYRLRAAQRGRYVLGPGRIGSGDPFGFYESERVVARAVASLVVMPRMPALPGVALRLARPVGERARRLPGFDDPSLPAGVREYRRGDPLRGMDWKVSARRGLPHVRVNDSGVKGSVMLLLECDTRITGVWDTSPRSLEQVVRVAAALARDLLAAGHAVGLLANGVPPGDAAHIALAPGAGRDQLGRLLDALARVQPVVVKPLSVLVDEHAPRVLGFGTVMVCIAAVVQPDTRALLLARRRARMAAALIEVAERPGEALAGVQTLHLDPARVGGLS